jgi:hypothetical protein
MVQWTENLIAYFDKETISDRQWKHAEYFPEIFVLQAHSLVVPAPIWSCIDAFFCDTSFFKAITHSN